MAESGQSKSDNIPEVKVPEVAVEDGSDPDFDDLDDVLDQFSANAPPPTTQSHPEPSSKPAPTASGPGRPDVSVQAPPVPKGQGADENDEEFMARLTQEMQTAMSTLSADPAAAAATPEDIAKMGKQLEQFTQNMEDQGINPEDLLRAILGEETGRRVSDAALQEADKQAALSAPKDTSLKSTTKPSSTTSAPTAFEESIARAMNRMQTSETSAKTASSSQNPTQPSETDLMAQLLQAMDSESSTTDPSNPDNLSSMFLSMMETLTHKDMLYEPMKKLDSEFPAYLEKSKSKLSPEDLKRYTAQQVIVKELVGKFEEKGYSDEDSRCREYVWEKMQKMQELGSPPEDLLGGEALGMPNLSGLGAAGMDAGCPTQ